MKHVSYQAPLIEMRHVSRTFNGTSRSQPVLRDISLSAFPGKVHLLLGPSGSGKTTLLQIAAGLLRPTAGEVYLFGAQVDTYRQRDLQRLRAQYVGFVFQTFRLIDTLRVHANVAIVGQFIGLGRTASSDRATELLNATGVGHLADHYPRTLSQGEKQRVGIARALFSRPRLVLADEPTACLAADQGQEVITLLSEYAHVSRGCVLVASHDLRLTERADVIHELASGRMKSRAQMGAPVLAPAASKVTMSGGVQKHSSPGSRGSAPSSSTAG